MPTSQDFGGDWTEEKLKIVKKYLSAYTTIMAKQPALNFAYIDAFAGTGYRQETQDSNSQESLFPDVDREDIEDARAGSARIALEITPCFERYIFVERDANRFEQLQSLKEEFPGKADDIIFENRDANEYLQEVARKNWTHHRAVVFLDPFGMQVEWSTVKVLAETRAIDLWILFPLGAAVNRLLKTNGEIPDAWQSRLDRVFGTDEWYGAFYETHQNLLGQDTTNKKVSLQDIGEYYVERLRSIFDHVAERPRPLYNSKGVPLYWLCFASHNRVANKIAQHILTKTN